MSSKILNHHVQNTNDVIQNLYAMMKLKNRNIHRNLNYMQKMEMILHARNPEQYGVKGIGCSSPCVSSMMCLAASNRPKCPSHMCWNSETTFKILARYAF